MLSSERLSEIYKNIHVGKYDDIDLLTTEKLNMQEGDLCILKLFGLDPKDSARKIDDLDIGNCFRPTDVKYDAVVHSVNEHGRPTYMALINVQQNSKVHRFTPDAPIVKVEMYMDMVKLSEDGISKPMPGLMIMLNGSAGLLVIDRCIREKI